MPDSAISRALLENRDSLLGYIRVLVRDWSLAEELFQEIALVILQKTDEVRNFGAWSREIARRHVLDHWKKSSSRRQRLLSAEALETLETAYTRHDEEAREAKLEAQRRLGACLDGLPPHLRKIVDLRYGEDLPLQEIADRLRQSAGAVQVALSRIRMRLADCARRSSPGAELNLP